MTGAEFEKAHREMYYSLLNENLIDESLKDNLYRKASEARKKSLAVIAKQVIEQLKTDITIAAEHGYMKGEFNFEELVVDCDLIESSSYDAEYLYNSYDEILKFVKLWASSCHLGFKRMSDKDDNDRSFELSWDSKKG